MLSLQDILNNIGLGANFKGDRINALNTGATLAFKHISKERNNLAAKLKEMGVGEEEIHKICHQETGGITEAVGNQEGGNDTSKDSEGSG